VDTVRLWIRISNEAYAADGKVSKREAIFRPPRAPRPLLVLVVLGLNTTLKFIRPSSSSPQFSAKLQKQNCSRLSRVRSNFLLYLLWLVGLLLLTPIKLYLMWLCVLGFFIDTHYSKGVILVGQTCQMA